MAITCAKCGRQYDVTLFEYGRTINCACGERVGFEHKLNLTAGGELKFFADVNVARLVRWLRAIGLDTVWEDAISDADLVRRAILERRYVLTLDKRMRQDFRADHILLLKSEKPLEQFAEIIDRFSLEKPARLFTRCLICNTVLSRAGADEINAAPPAQRPASGANVFYCPRCRKIYWEGSHTRRMRAAIEAIFAR